MGLIAHYTLDNQGGVGENLLTNSYINLTRHEAAFYCNVLISFSMSEIQAMGLKNGDTLIFGAGLENHTNADILRARIQHYNTDVDRWQALGASIPINSSGWSWASVILNTSYQQIDLLFDCQCGTNYSGYYLFKHCKLEKGSTPTAYIPHKSEAAGATSPYNLEANIVQSQSDVEAHTPKYNGVKTGSINFTTDTPRYNSATDFTASDGAITIGNLNTMLGGNNPFTFNIGFKKKTDEGSSKRGETIFGGPSGFELEMKIADNNINYIHPYSWGGGSVNSPNSYSIQYPLDQGNMLTMVRTTSDTKYYLNGELKVTGSAGTIPSGNYFLGAGNTINGQNYRGLMSDARIYNHALSASEINELYNGGRK